MNISLSSSPTFLLSLFPTGKRGASPHPFPTEARDAVLLAGKEDMRKGEILYPWVKEILSNQATIIFSAIQHYLWI